jgi:hypothetical protein
LRTIALLRLFSDIRHHHARRRRQQRRTALMDRPSRSAAAVPRPRPIAPIGDIRRRSRVRRLRRSAVRRPITSSFRARADNRRLENSVTIHSMRTATLAATLSGTTQAHVIRLTPRAHLTRHTAPAVGGPIFRGAPIRISAPAPANSFARAEQRSPAHANPTAAYSVAPHPIVHCTHALAAAKRDASGVVEGRRRSNA